MNTIMYMGDKIIIEQSGSHGIIHYLDEGITKKWSLDWNELMLEYKEAIKNDTNGKYYDELFKEIIINK